MLLYGLIIGLAVSLITFVLRMLFFALTRPVTAATLLIHGIVTLVQWLLWGGAALLLLAFYLGHVKVPWWTLAASGVAAITWNLTKSRLIVQWLARILDQDR